MTKATSLIVLPLDKDMGAVYNLAMIDEGLKARAVAVKLARLGKPKTHAKMAVIWAIEALDEAVSAGAIREYGSHDIIGLSCMIAVDVVDVQQMKAED